MKTLIALLCAVILTGCAHFTTTQTDVSYGDDGRPIREVTTRAKACTFFSAKSSLTNFKASQTDKTQSASVGALAQQADATNVVAALEAIARIVEAVRPTP